MWSWSVSYISNVIAFRASARLNVRTATRPSRSSRISPATPVVIADVLLAGRVLHERRDPTPIIPRVHGGSGVRRILWYKRAPWSEAAGTSSCSRSARPPSSAPPP